MVLSILIVKVNLEEAHKLVKLLTGQFPIFRFQAATVSRAMKLLREQYIQLLIIDQVILMKDKFNFWAQFPNPHFDIICAGKNPQHTSFALQFFANPGHGKLNTNNSSVLSTTLALPNANGFHYIDSQQILYCRAARNYTELHLVNGKKLVISKNIKYMEAQLENFPFLRVGRSYIINLRQVKSYSRKDGGYVELSNDIMIPVSNLYKENLLSILNGEV